MANTLIFFDLPSDDVTATARFYEEVFGWRNDEKPLGVYHRMVPGGNFANPDGSESEIGNLHMGIYDAANARPHPNPAGVEPHTLCAAGRAPRLWVLVDEMSAIDGILSAAEERGATILWRDHFWATFNGFNWAIRDPWGNEVILWVKGGDEPQIPAHFSHE